MIRHFFLDKTNTIIENCDLNFSLNPILSLCYGKGIMRGLIHFDMDQIKQLIDDKTFSNIDKLKFSLKMTNCFSLNSLPYNQKLIRSLDTYCERACSCDIVLFKLPCEFDSGRGYDYIQDFWVHDKKNISKEGSTWFYSKTMIPWSEKYIKNYNIKKDEGGIYKKYFLEKEYEKFKNGEKSIIIGEQHFEYGNENLSIDITDYVFECLKTNENRGLCLSFSPFYESKERDMGQCLDFFTDHTNTFFHPYIEAVYNETINDNRLTFNKNKDNRLYLYVYDDGNPFNLDKLPICTIEDKEYKVKQASKGVYFAEIPIINNLMDEGYVYYDKWSEIVLNGVTQSDIEMEFYVPEISNNLSIGNKSNIKINIIPSIYGINDNESLNQYEIREVNVDFIEKFTSDKKHLLTTAEYRLYVKDGENEIDIINFHPIELANENNYFLIHTMDLIPNKYFIDIRAFIGREKLYFKNVLNFNIVGNVSERYQ